MRIIATISTHNGSTLSQRHNRRDKKITEKEKHIKENGQHESWLDIDIKDAYKKIFGQAQEDYNTKQKRKDRQIENYLKKIEQDKQKHPCYEMIVGVYGKDVSEQQKKEILWDFAKGWKERNPNLKMIGCYWHNDEDAEQHLHIDYIPTAECDKGMRLQNSLDRAFKQQGIECGESIHETRQINWQKRENKILENLCTQKGIEVKHNTTYKGHENTSAYKQRKLKEENQKQKEINAKNNKILHKQVELYKEQQKELEEISEKLAKGRKKLEELKNEYIEESLGDLKKFAPKEVIENQKRQLDF